VTTSAFRHKPILLRSFAASAIFTETRGRDVIARGIFTSVANLSRKLMRYIRVRQVRQTVPLGLTQIRADASNQPNDRDASLVFVSTVAEGHGQGQLRKPRQIAVTRP
jgi:hypothetical protein